MRTLTDSSSETVVLILIAFAAAENTLQADPLDNLSQHSILEQDRTH